MTASKNPKLRFKDENGKNFPDWKVFKLGDLLQKISTGLNPRNNFVLGEGDCFYITIKNIKNGHLIFDSAEKITLESLQLINNRSSLEEGDLIMSSIGNIGEAFLIKEKPKNWNINESVFSLKPNKNLIRPEFLYYTITNSNMRSYLESHSTGTSFKSIKSGQLKLTPINIPNLEEQIRISKFLENIDIYTQNLKSQKEELEKYKKAVMQKIFSQQLRFKDVNGKDFSDWRLYKFNDFLIEKNIKSKINNQYEVISSTIGGIFSQKEYFNREIASKNNIGYKVIESNDLVFSPQNLWLGNININQRFKYGIVSPSYKIYKVKEDIVLIELLKHLIKSNRMLYEYELSSEQGASVVRRNLNIELFNSIPIRLPSISEQKKISQFIYFIDELIETKSKEIENAENWKKGLMQQMFI